MLVPQTHRAGTEACDYERPGRQCGSERRGVGCQEGPAGLDRGLGNRHRDCRGRGAGPDRECVFAMRTGAVCVGVLVVAAALASLPPSNLYRDAICLNGLWQFQPADAELSFPPGGAWHPVPIRIPSPWNVNSFSRGDGGDFRCFPSYPEAWEKVLYAWHRRKFTVPRSWSGKRIFLRFEAVSYWADVYLNGRRVGSHEGGFTPFELDVTRAVRVGSENELVVGVRDRSYYDVQGRRPYPWGSFWGGHIRGIWQDVYLIARPRLYVADVFVRTSVARRRLTAEVTVANTTGEPALLVVRATVRPWRDDGSGDGSPPRIVPARLEVPANGRRTVTLQVGWPGPRLWWPHAPFLYVLTTSLHRAGIEIDRLDTRFGFREFTLPEKGHKFKLNGITWTGRGDAWHFMGIPQLTPDFARAWYSMARRAHVNIIRLHAQVYPSYYLDVADEMGMLIVDETSIWGSAGNLYYNDDFMRRARQHVRELVLRDRNHPSVVIWSVANEIGYFSPRTSGAPSRDWIYARYAELAREMQRLDPTRPVSCDGDWDLGGRLPICSLHYPGPNRPNTRARFITIGESGSMFYSTPAQVSYRIGDRAYRSSLDRLEAVGLEIADLIEGYRKWAAYATPFNLQWYGLQPLPLDLKFTYQTLNSPGVKPERLGPYCTTLNAGRDPRLPEFVPNPVFEHVRRAFIPVRFFVDQRGCSVCGGRILKRTLTVHNDTLRRVRLRLSWRLSGAGSVLASGRVWLDMEPGAMEKTTLSLPLPDVKQMRRLRWTIVAMQGERVWYEEQRDLFVYPPQPAPLSLGRRVVLYDPHQRAGVAGRWVKATKVAALEKVPEGSLLIVGPGAVGGRGASQALLRAVERGVMCLVLEDNAWPPAATVMWEPAGGDYRLAFAKLTHHPILAGLREEQLRYWSPDGVVGRRAFRGVPPVTALPVITCRDGDWAMLEVAAGRGRAIVSALPLAEKMPNEPAARELFLNALRYLDGATAPNWQSVAVDVSVGRGAMLALRALGVGVEGQSRGAEAELLVVGGSRRLGEAAVARARAILDRGGTVVVLGARPPGQRAVEKLLGCRVKLSRCDEIQLVPAAQGIPLLAGFDLADLYWLSRDGGENILPWAVDVGGIAAERLLVTNRTDWRRWVGRGENVKTASVLRSELEDRPLRCGAVVVPVGRGQAVLWQVPVRLANLKSMRALALLLANLRVPIRARKLTERERASAYLDDEGYIGAWLSLGPIDGRAEQLYRDDLLGGEATPRPVAGVVAHGCAWVVRVAGRQWDLSARKWFGERAHSCVYAAVYILSPKPRRARLLVGSDDYMKLWLNGRLVHANPAVRPLKPDQDVVGPVELRKGWNVLLAKVVNVTGRWGLSVRVVDEQYEPIDDLGISLFNPWVQFKEIPHAGWRARANPQGQPQLAFDGDEATRWTTSRPMDDSMWFELDMGRVQTVARIVLDAAGSPGDYPRRLKVEVSEDGRQWTAAASIEHGDWAQARGVMVVTIAPVRARFVRLRQLGPEGCSDGLWWSIHELRVFQPQ